MDGRTVKEVKSDAQLPPSVLKALIESAREPLVIKGQLRPWMNFRSWDVEDICGALGSKAITFKVFPRRATETYREFSVTRNKVPDETDCVYVSGKVEDFRVWWQANSHQSLPEHAISQTDSSSNCANRGASSSASLAASSSDNLYATPYTSASSFLSLSFSTPQQPCSNSLLEFPASEFWVYADYNYLSKMCDDAPDLVAAVDWSIFGFDEQSGQDSALWMGSTGAFTPCHQDTYGFNIVAMLSGEKTWTLFCPDDSQCMYPTRIPFEESSVFSEVDVADPDYRKHPLFRRATPYQVVLRAGDVLIVPRHWWHYVECTGTTPSVSINTWVNLPSDSLDRLKETIVRCMVSAFVDSENDEARCLINPNEELFTNEVNIGLVNIALNDHLKSLHSKDGHKQKGKAALVEDWYETFLKAVTSASVVDAVVKSLGVHNS